MEESWVPKWLYVNLHWTTMWEISHWNLGGFITRISLPWTIHFPISLIRWYKTQFNALLINLGSLLRRLIIGLYGNTFQRLYFFFSFQALSLIFSSPLSFLSHTPSVSFPIVWIYSGLRKTDTMAGWHLSIKKVTHVLSKTLSGKVYVFVDNYLWP